MTTTADRTRDGQDQSVSFVEGDGPDLEAEAAYARQARRSERIRLLVQPVVVILVAAGVLIWAFGIHTITDTESPTLNYATIRTLLQQHVLITVVVTAIVLAVAIPIGILLTRPATKRLAPIFIGLANIGASAPAIGLLVLYYLLTQSTGFWTGVLPIAAYSLLPVLRNTILGFEEVDPTLVDAARGQGMAGAQILRRVEFPLAVPYILAGLRTTLVLAVGTATLSFLVGGGGLGVLIETGYVLTRPAILIVGAVLAVALALLVDWLGALAEQYLGPKGLR